MEAKQIETSWRLGVWSGRCNRPDHSVPHPGPGGENGCTFTYREDATPADLIAGTPDEHYTILPGIVDAVGLERARLIAAAPELISALRQALVFVEEEADNRGAAGSEHSDYEREPRELSDVIAAAIRKATGEA